MITRKLVLFLVRRRLGIRKREMFVFENQKSASVYYFAGDKLWRTEAGKTAESGVSLNWLLNDQCKVKPKDEAWACESCEDRKESL